MLFNIFPLEKQVLQFDILTIIYLIIILVCIIVGGFKGFFKTFLTFMVWLISTTVSLFVTIPIANFLMTFPFKETIYQAVYSYLSNGREEIFNTIITPENKEIILSLVNEQAVLPLGIEQLFIFAIDKEIPVNGIQVGVLLSNQVTFYVMSGISFLISFFITFIIFFIIKFILQKAFKKNKSLKVFNRILGGINGLFAGGVICLVISYCLSFLVNFNEGFYAFANNLMCLDDDNVYTLSKMLYQNNFLQWFLSLF